MHRLAAVPGQADAADDGGAGVAFVEQPPAPVLLLSSADTDLVAVAALLRQRPDLLQAELRALNLAALAHPAVIDHYRATTLPAARVVLVRLLGGRGHWSYGLEQLRAWAAEPGTDGVRQLLVVSGTAELDQDLADLGTVPPELTVALGECLRQGGSANLELVLGVLSALLSGTLPAPPEPRPAPDPLPHDWRQEPGPRVGVILYRALLQAGDTALMEETLAELRRQGLCPRGLWVSSLRDAAVQRGVGDLLAREQVEAVLCGTGFASVQFEEAGLGAPLWDQLGVPVLQMLCSSRPRAGWAASSIGLGPLDLSLQVALPELDGRIGTRVAAFKELAEADSGLATALQRLEPETERLAWIVELCRGWITLARTAAPQRRLALVLANYPTRNSRVANGVGLDTPASAALMLHWLAESGHDLGDGALPGDGDALIHQLLAGRSNDPESGHRPPLDHLPLEDYLAWYEDLPEAGRRRLEEVWGAPGDDVALVATASGPAFPVRGLRFGRVVVLIQPERGYDRDPALSYHSPDLPPTHAYLAQYLWLRRPFAAQAVLHVGKHGTLEWLPGKGVGLSADCFPEWAIGPLPHLYPFIVNDPGEGSQAKRRSQAVILDHLTPPLGRAGLHGELQGLEALLDEYWEAVQLGGERAGPLRQQLAQRLQALDLPVAGDALAPDPAPGKPAAGADRSPAAAVEGSTPPERPDFDARLEAADGYLCELKEAQIRLGLHTYGRLPEPQRLVELLLCLARAPQEGRPGFTQAIARDLGLALDPWADPEEAPLPEPDRQRLGSLAGSSALRRVGDAVALLEERALALLRPLLNDLQDCGLALDETQRPSLSPEPPQSPGAESEAALAWIESHLLPRLLACGEAERQAFLGGVAGERIAAGPSGAPTRGRPDLLPTGRNFYSVDLRGLPSEAAWDLGRRSAEQLLDLHRLEQGQDLRTLALSVWGTATMRNGGEDIAQALALMGVRPVWDGPTRRLVEVEVIPLALLGRPRVDVTLRISGLFRDAFPQLVGWFNRATRLVATLSDEGEANPLALAAAADGSWGRVWGSAPGAYGAGLQGLIDSGQWESRGDLAAAYLSWSQWRYDGEMLAGATGMVGGPVGGDDGPIGDQTRGDTLAPRLDRTGLERRLAQVEVVLHNQDNREHDLLDSDDYYQFQGGLSVAVETLSGRRPALWFGDHSRHQRPRLHRLEKEFDKVLRSRLLNPRWIEAMGEHGYKGGFEMAASLDYLFAYDASTGRMPAWGYGAISRTWLADPRVLAALRRSNPWALRDMAERLLEAHQRGLWQEPGDAEIERLRELVLDSEGLIEQA